MKNTIVAVLVSFLAVTSAVDIKQKLKELRDPANIKRENVVEFLSNRHERRMEKLDEMLEHRKLQMKEHHAGRQLLNDEDHARVTRQLVNFERKLQQLRSMPEEDKAEMYDTEAESIFKMNSVEYLDFNA